MILSIQNLLIVLKKIKLSLIEKYWLIWRKITPKSLVKSLKLLNKQTINKVKSGEEVDELSLLELDKELFEFSKFK